MNRAARFLLYILPIFLLWGGCAVQKAPGGGPEDKSAPEFLEADPPSGSINVSADRKIIFRFSEALDDVSVKRGLTVFPANITPVDIKYSKRSIIVIPREGWKEDQAYSILIDNAVTDLRKNSLNGSISYSFSTGANIPQGRIRGQVYGLQRGETATIFLGPALSPDSLFRDYRYFIQSSREGGIAMDYMPEGIYRVLGYLDQDKSRSYDPRRDDLVLPTALDITVTSDTSRAELEMQVLRGNFLEPLLLSAKQLFPGKIQIKYSKFPKPDQKFSTFSIDSTEADTVIAENEYLNVYYQPFCADSLLLSIPSVQDTFGLYSHDTTLTIKPRAFLDTAYTYIWKDSLLTVEPSPPTDSIPALFTGREDTLMFAFRSAGPGIYTADLQPPFKGTASFSLLPPPCVSEFPDTSRIEISISRKEPSPMGSLNVLLAPEEGRVLFIPVRGGGVLQQEASGRSCFFPNIPAGTHALYSYIDRNGNGRVDWGRLLPEFQPPEIIKLRKEGIEIRANWETEIDLTVSEPEAPN